MSTHMVEKYERAIKANRTLADMAEEELASLNPSSIKYKQKRRYVAALRSTADRQETFLNDTLKMMGEK